MAEGDRRNDGERGFLEKQTAVISFMCSRCHFVREIKVRKSPVPNTLEIVDIKAGTKDTDKKVYELETHPFPTNQKELTDYALRGHGAMFHQTGEVQISDYRS